MAHNRKTKLFFGENNRHKERSQNYKTDLPLKNTLKEPGVVQNYIVVKVPKTAL